MKQFSYLEIPHLLVFLEVKQPREYFQTAAVFFSKCSKSLP